jgi:hypothetical protein
MAADPFRHWSNLLAGIVPRNPDVGLLRSVLWDGPSAQTEWSAWTKTVGDPKAYFQSEFSGRKGLLAFVSQRISANRIDVGDEFSTYARVARVREHLRARIFLDSLHAVHAALRNHGLEPVLINGAAYAFSIYTDAFVRHNHAIDFWLPGRFDAARDALSATGFLHVQTAVQRTGILETYRHRNGLALTLRSELFSTPHVAMDSAEFLHRSRPLAVEHTHLRVLAPTDRLCHTLGETALAPTRRNLRWACDGYLLIARGGVDFAELGVTAERLGTALPSGLLLRFFRERLRLDVPEAVVERLLLAGVPSTRNRSALLLSIGLRCSESVGAFMASASHDWISWATALRFALFPSMEHLAYTHPSRTRVAVPLWYALRIARFLLGPIYSGALRWLGRSAPRIALRPHPARANVELES